MSLQGQIADAFVSLYESNRTGLTALIKSKNVTIVAFVESAAEQLVAKNPMLQLVFQGEIKGAGPQLIAYLGSEENAAYAALDASLRSEAKTLGGAPRVRSPEPDPHKAR